MPAQPRLVLASTSPARLRLLRAAGLEVFPVRPTVDEAAAKAAFAAEGLASEAAASALAEIKAASVAGREEGLVIGADQLLVADDEAWLDKPRDEARARAQLRRLAGRTHRLVTAAVAFAQGRRIWGHVAAPRVTLRPLSEEAITSYLALAGEEALHCVGGYAIEGLGAQLATRVEGDLFAVQGLPLLELLGFLRGHGIGVR